jgi:acyl-CoA reductase-like NAD-dependent aldehyde dehydrogenase
LLRDPELPPGVVNVIAETGHAGARCLVASHDVDVISFTGSTNVGKEIMRSAAGSMKKLSLELGGKSCSLVFQDADVAPVVARLAAAATIISGQQCTAARRVLVHSSRLAEMRAALAAALAALRVGPGLDAATEIGPLIDWSSRDQVAERIEQACAEADEVLLAPRIPGGALARGAEAETGGYRQSGLGRLHGYDALADFTELKHIYQAPGVTATAG